jgi:hypothetical protein
MKARKNQRSDKWYKSRMNQAAMIGAIGTIVAALIYVHFNKPADRPNISTEGLSSPGIVTSGPNSPAITSYSAPNSISQIMTDSPGGLQVAGDMHVHEAEQPLDKAIGKATATVEVTIESDDDFQGTVANVGALLAFMKGQTPLLTTSTIGYAATQKGSGQVTYKADLTMDAGDSAIGRPVSFLRESDHVLLTFGRMPPDSRVLGGRALCTVNEVNIELPIPEQVAKGTKIFVRNLAEPLEVLNQYSSEQK